MAKRESAVEVQSAVEAPITLVRNAGPALLEPRPQTSLTVLHIIMSVPIMDPDLYLEIIVIQVRTTTSYHVHDDSFDLG
jgi:hypothetical protein